MRDVYVIGAYTTVFKKHPGMSFADLAREAYMGTLADAGMNKGADIESGWLGNCGMGFWGQNSIRAQALFQPLIEEGLRQVKGAQIALAENGGGVIGMEEAVASVMILQRD